jgi:non-heme chloroperoxidase
MQKAEVPTLVARGDDDRIVPCKDAARLSVKLLKQGTLKIYPGFPHGMLTHPRRHDLLAFVRG